MQITCSNYGNSPGSSASSVDTETKMIETGNGDWKRYSLMKRAMKFMTSMKAFATRSGRIIEMMSSPISSKKILSQMKRTANGHWMR